MEQHLQIHVTVPCLCDPIKMCKTRKSSIWKTMKHKSYISAIKIFPASTFQTRSRVNTGCAAFLHLHMNELFSGVCSGGMTRVNALVIVTGIERSLCEKNACVSDPFHNLRYFFKNVFVWQPLWLQASRWYSHTPVLIQTGSIIICK